MTNELEKKFFDTFGIEAKKQCYYWDCPYSTGNIVNDTAMNERDCNSCKNPDKEIYLQITDRILLGLICIANEYENYPETTNMKNIKERTLRILLRAEKFYDKNHYGSDRQYKKLVKRVCTLFKGDNNV